MQAPEFKRALAALGWRQVDAANRFDVSKALVSMMASGKTPVPAWIADALDAAVDAKLAILESV